MARRSALAAGPEASTIRSYSEAVRAFCHFVDRPALRVDRRPARSGSAPTRSRSCTSGTPRCTSRTTRRDPKKRAFTKAELHAFFDHCDDEVARIRAFGRKGWLPAFRDATLFKTAYAYGLRRNETRMLDAADFGRNPHGAEFGEYGRVPRPVRQGQEGLAAQAAQRADCVAVDPRHPRRVVHRGPPAARRRRQPGAWPSERGAADRLPADRLPVRRLPAGPRPGRRAGLPLPTPLLRHASHRGRLGPAVRPGAGRT